jgi:rhamnose utilization protein RhaD (predicted bifunctional aldolase and dehydrogenase)
VIFLGTKLGVLADGQSLAGFLADFERRSERPPKLVIVPGKGIVLSEELTVGGHALARCLAEVVGRIPADEPVVYLSPDEEWELTSWEAEKYRQSLDRAAK